MDTCVILGVMSWSARDHTHLEYSLDIVGSDIFVLEVVGVLPHVDAKERDEACGGLKRVLVRAGGNLKFARLFVVSQPTPAGALHCHRHSAQLGLHGVEAAKVSLDSVSQGS